MSIIIISQSGDGQYDTEERQITHWDEKRCAWIINKPYRGESIDWNGFSGGYTKHDYEKENPGWSQRPDISVRWYWDTAGRNWGDLDFSKEKAIEHLGKYCSFNKHASRVVVNYNNETIFDGVLT